MKQTCGFCLEGFQKHRLADVGKFLKCVTVCKRRQMGGRFEWNLSVLTAVVSCYKVKLIISEQVNN